MRMPAETDSGPRAQNMSGGTESSHTWLLSATRRATRWCSRLVLSPCVELSVRQTYASSVGYSCVHALSDLSRLHQHLRASSRVSSQGLLSTQGGLAVISSGITAIDDHERNSLHVLFANHLLLFEGNIWISVCALNVFKQSSGFDKQRWCQCCICSVYNRAAL